MLLKKIFASFLTQKVWRFAGFPHICACTHKRMRTQTYRHYKLSIDFALIELLKFVVYVWFRRNLAKTDLKKFK